MNNAVPPALDAVVLKGLSRDAANRFATAREMAAAIEATVPVATPMKVAEWDDEIMGPTLAARDAMRAEIESGSHSMRQVSSEPLSQPSLPGFPQVADSSVSIPRITQSTGDMAGINESSASAVMLAPAVPARVLARSRMPWVIAIVAVVGALGLAIGVVVSRPPAVVQPAATQAPTHVVETTAATAPTQAPSATTAPTPSAAVLQAPSASASHHARTGPASTKPNATHPGPAGSGNDLNSLLDTR
jgi:serine/threonine-protein kinase